LKTVLGRGAGDAPQAALVSTRQIACFDCIYLWHPGDGPVAGFWLGCVQHFESSVTNQLIWGPLMKKLALAAAAIFALFAGSASAADMAVKAPPLAAPVFSWTGFYVGLNAGGGWNERTGDHFCVTPGGVLAGVGCSVSVNGTVEASGALAGGQIGYNWQTGSIVWGGEADIQWSGIKGSSAFNLACRSRPLPDLLPRRARTSSGSAPCVVAWASPSRSVVSSTALRA
jgi:hypothetical protein